MDYLDEQVEALLAQIRMAGGRAWIDPEAPQEIKRAFLKSIHDCPDCQADFRRTPKN